jgi:hypothetical protein
MSARNLLSPTSAQGAAEALKGGSKPQTDKPALRILLNKYRKIKKIPSSAPIYCEYGDGTHNTMPRVNRVPGCRQALFA